MTERKYTTCESLSDNISNLVLFWGTRACHVRCTSPRTCVPAASGPVLARHSLEGTAQRPRDDAAPSRQSVGTPQLHAERALPTSTVSIQKQQPVLLRKAGTPSGRGNFSSRSIACGFVYPTRHRALLSGRAVRCTSNGVLSAWPWRRRPQPCRGRRCSHGIRRTVIGLADSRCCRTRRCGRGGPGR